MLNVIMNMTYFAYTNIILRFASTNLLFMYIIIITTCYERIPIQEKEY